MQGWVLMTRRDLSDEEAALWQHVTQHTMPLERRVHVDSNAHKHAGGAPKIQVSHKTSMPVFAAAEFSHLPPLQQGAKVGVDRRTAARFTRGNLSIDATLDLHGMNREMAHHRTAQFVHRHYQNGSRCVLIITGKGTRQISDDDDVARGALSGGILREQLPLWLADDALRPMIVAYEHAQQRHGGSGAYYVLLKRKR